MQFRLNDLGTESPPPRILHDFMGRVLDCLRSVDCSLRLDELPLVTSVDGVLYLTAAVLRGSKVAGLLDCRFEDEEFDGSFSPRERPMG